MSPCFPTVVLPISVTWKQSMPAHIRTLCLSLTACAVLLGQTEVTPPPTKGFTVTVLQGDGLLNPLPRPPGAHLSIRVADTNGQPVHNAVTVFELPDAGASASFIDGSNVKVLLTNDRGEAVADIHSNEVTGKYQATVTVNYLGQSSLVRLNQENAFPYGTPAAGGRRPLHKRGFFSRKTVLIIAAAAIAGIATIFATHRGHTPITPPPPSGITITPGTGTVGAH
jgi:hypothetical protein